LEESGVLYFRGKKMKDDKETERNTRSGADTDNHAKIILPGLLILFILYLTSLYSYPLFHSLIEIYVVVIAGSVFILAWNTREYMDNDYLLLIGISYLFVGIIELLHALAYILKPLDANPSVQLWIAARYLESLSFLIAPLYLRRKLNRNVAFAAYACATFFLLSSIFYWRIFPNCFLEGSGLTPFKIVSEYIVILILAVAIALLFRYREKFERDVLWMLVLSMVLTILAEFFFTLYIRISGLSNVIGHFLTLISFYLIYRAVIVTGLTRPSALLYRNLAQSEAALTRVNEELEATVADRTADLIKTNEQLKIELMERKRAEEALQESEKQVRRELDAILSPEADIGTLELSDIIDSEKIQKLMDELYRLTHIGIGIIDLQGRVLVGTGWQDICTKFHRVNPESCRLCIESDLELSRGVPVGTFKQYRCKNNMWDIATPIMLGDRYVGNIFLGQFLFDDETPDYETFRQQARLYGFNEQEYIEALDRVPRWSRETVNATMTFYAVFAGMIGNLSYSNVKLAYALEERKRAEEELSRVNRALLMLSDTNQAVVRITDEATLLNEVCRIAVDVGGYRLAWVGFAEHNEAKTLRPVARAGFDSGYIESARVTWADDERGRGPGGTAIRTGQPCIARNILQDPSFAPWREEAIQRGYQSIIALPLTSEGLTLGAMGIYADKADAFNAGEVEVLKEMADDLAYGIIALRTRAERDLAEEALRQSEKEKAIRNEIANIFLTIPDEAMYGEVLDVVLRVMKSKYGIFGYIDENEDLVIPSLTRDIWRECQVPGKSIVFPSDSWGESMWGRAIREKRTFCSDGPFHTPEGHVPIDHFLATPIIYGQETIGLISVANKEGGYGEDDKDLLELIAGKISPILHARLQRDRLDGKSELALEALKESEEKYRHLVTSAPAGIYELDLASRRFISVNEVMCQLTGYTREEFLLMDPLQLLSEESQSVFMQRIAGAFSGEQVPDTVEYRIRGKNGREFWVLLNSKYSFGPENRLTATVVVQDITERKRAEEALRESEENYRNIFENAVMGIFQTIPDGRYLRANPAGVRMYGYESPEDMIQSVADMSQQIYVNPEDRARFKEIMEGKGYVVGFESEHYRKDKSRIWTVLNSRAVRDKTGRTLHYETTIEDITERKRAEIELRDTLKQLQDAKDMLVQSEKLAAIGRLSAGVGHEILNPLNIISMRMQFLEMTEKLPDKVKEGFATMFKQIDRIVKITKDLSQFSRISKRDMIKKDMNQLMEHILSLVIPRLRVEQVTLETEFQPELPRILMEPDRVEQVVLNIINNAVDALEGRENKMIKVTSGLTRREGRDYLRLTISDNGRGIPGENIDKLFEPFFTTKEAGKGTGLGLHICYTIIQEHGGRIRAENKTEGGASFFIELPTEDQEG